MCDSLALAPARSASGATLFAKNSDRNENECQPFEQHPAAIYVRGAITRCTHIEIPQVAETYRVMGHAPWWLWGFEHGVNEHGVAVGNQTVFSREPIEDEPGLIGMDLVEVAPVYDIGEITALAGATLAMEMVNAYAHRAGG